MATLSSLAIRNEAAFDRIEKELGINLHAFYHRDPAVMETLRIEAIADALADKTKEIPAVPKSVGKDDPLVTVETVEIVDTGTKTVIGPDDLKAKAKK
jgi:hypothetical protein